MRNLNSFTNLPLTFLLLFASLMLCGCESPLMSVERMAGSVLLGSQSIQAVQRFPGGRGNSGGVESIPAPPEAQAEQAELAFEGSLPAPPPGRLMVYSARYRLSAPNVEEALSRLTRRVAQVGGYLESREDNHVVCRVPATQFRSVIGELSSLGKILSQSIKSQDVTTAHRDLNMRMETAIASRVRVLALLEKAEKIEDVLKLEETLRSLTEQIEQIRGQLKGLSEQITYSRIEVEFQAHTPTGKMSSMTHDSPFAWINRVGLTQVTEAFSPMELADIKEEVIPPTLWPDAIRMELPGEFLVVVHRRDELKAITPDESKLWVRKFSLKKRGDLTFWTAALKKHLMDHRGYKLLGERNVDGPGKTPGHEMVFETNTHGAVQLYLATIYVNQATLWSRSNSLRLVEFVAPPKQFDRYLPSVQQAAAGHNRNPTRQ